MPGPRTPAQVEALLERLDEGTAADLESQDLDFKEWDTRSLNPSVRTAVAAAVCMANGGGGTVVFGVADDRLGRDCAILGVPPEVSVNRLKLAVHDGTDPTLIPGARSARAARRVRPAMTITYQVMIAAIFDDNMLSPWRLRRI